MSGSCIILFLNRERCWGKVVFVGKMGWGLGLFEKVEEIFGNEKSLRDPGLNIPPAQSPFPSK